MKIKVIVHQAQEGGFGGEVPAIPGCASQGGTIDELIANLPEAIEGSSLSMSDSHGQVARSASWKSPFEAAFRPRLCTLIGETRLAAAANQRQPSHLWQARQCGAVVRTIPDDELIAIRQLRPELR